MVNGLAVLGWGVGGIEAEAAMLGPADLHADPGSHRLPSRRRARRRRDRHGPCADGCRNAAQEGRGRQIRGILRSRPRQPVAGRRRHHRQHGSGIRRHLRLLPRRRRHAGVSHLHGPRQTTASRWWKPMPAPRACSATPTPSRSSPTRCSSIFPPSFPPSPAPSARRTASPSTWRPKASPRSWKRNSRRRTSSASALPSRAATTILATATW